MSIIDDFKKQVYEEGYADGKRDAVVHGKWIIKEREIRKNGTTYAQWLYECSNCGERPLIKHNAEIMSDYCPCCGAKMDFLVMDCPDGEKVTE